MRSAPWANSAHLNVIVKQGVLHLWSRERSQSEREALVLAAKEAAGVEDLVDHTDRSVTVY